MSAPVWSVTNKVAWNYVFVVDASLTAVTADVYRYNNTAGSDLPLLQLEASKVFAGLEAIVALPELNQVKKRFYIDGDANQGSENDPDRFYALENSDADPDIDANFDFDFGDVKEDPDANPEADPEPVDWKFEDDPVAKEEGANASEEPQASGDDEAVNEGDVQAKLGELLDSIVAFGQEILPKQQLVRTPLFLYGTGNLRSLDMFAKHKLMRGTCTYLQQHSDFLIEDCKQIATMHEDVEGLMTWIAVNYGDGTPPFTSELGSIVLNDGGSSVAYVESKAKSQQYKVAFGGSMYDVHVDSNDGLGLGDAWGIYSTTEDGSCLNPGYNGSLATGTGSYDDCTAAISFLLEEAPAAPASIKYHASGAWSQLSQLFDSEQSARDFCATEWSQIDGAKYVGAENLDRLCFDVVYAQSLERKLFEEAPMTPLTDYSPVAWTKGRALLYASAELSGSDTTGIQTNSGASTWQFGRDGLLRPKLGDWAERIDRQSHRAYGGLVFLAVLVGIAYLLLGKAKRRHLWNRVRGYKHISAEDFELDDRRASDDFEVA